MLISYSGRAGVGKDLAGQITSIILNNTQLNNEGVLEFLRKEIGHSGDWNIKKWADKLKDIVCLLLSCTREQLEDREFKEKDLGPEWNKWIMRKIDSDGYTYSYEEILYFESKESAYSHCTTFPTYEYSEPKLINLTPRLLLQLLGTECGRNIIHPNIWVNALMSQYKPYSKGIAHDLKNWSEVYKHTSCKNCGKEYNGWKRQYLCKECIENNSVQFYPNWIITDTRFPNELEAVKDKGGITIRINRKPEGKWIDKQEWDLHTKGIVPHESETSLDSYTEWDYVIENNGTIRDLIEKIREILIKEECI